jgi:hypothetical protein
MVEEVGAMSTAIVLVCGTLPFAFIALLGWAAVADVRSGRGYGLSILTSVLLAITVVVVGGITILAQVQPPPQGPHRYSVTIWLVFYFIAAVYADAFTLIGAAVVAGKARHWLWILGFFVAALVPTLVVAVPYPYRFYDLNTGYIVQNIGFLGMLIAPEATILAYSITRIRHPVARARARQPAF